MNRKINVWILSAGGNNNLGVMPCDLRYYHTNFIGESMADKWKPPPLDYLGKSKKLRDFVSWMEQAPLVSEKAKNLIQQLCGDDVEFLRFHDLKDKPYYAMNVLRIEDALDLTKCDLTKYGDTDELISINTYVFKETLLELPPIFKEPTALNTIFVTEAFAKMAIENKLTGLALADPAVNQLQLVIKGIDPNVVEGIII